MADHGGKKGNPLSSLKNNVKIIIFTKFLDFRTKKNLSIGKIFQSLLPKGNFGNFLDALNESKLDDFKNLESPLPSFPIGALDFQLKRTHNPELTLSSRLGGGNHSRFSINTWSYNRKLSWAWALTAQLAPVGTPSPKTFHVVENADGIF